MDLKPDDLRALANAARVDAEWVARAKQALFAAAEEWESSQLAVLDEIEIATYGGD